MLVVLQTMWFLLQCAVRGSPHLALTELELAMSALTLSSTHAGGKKRWMWNVISWCVGRAPLRIAWMHSQLQSVRY